MLALCYRKYARSNRLVNCRFLLFKCKHNLSQYLFELVCFRLMVIKLSEGVLYSIGHHAAGFCFLSANIFFLSTCLNWFVLG